MTSCKPQEKTRVHIIYSLHAEQQSQPDWPNIGFDFRPAMELINQELVNQLSDFEFLTSTASGPEEAEKIITRDASDRIDGYLVYQMNCWNRVVQTIAKAGKPVLYADFQFAGSGGFLVYNAAFLHDVKSIVGFVASSKMEDLVNAVNCFKLAKNGGSVQDFVKATNNARKKNTPAGGDMACNADELNLLPIHECVERLKESKILAVRNTESAILESFIGIPVHQIPFAEINAAFEQTDKEKAQEIATQWIQHATKVIDVPLETLNASAAFYLGMKKVLKEHHAYAITINCLGGFYGGHIHTYPCLGFHQLNNDGLIGGCECDIESAATMVAFTTLTQGRPGYISDPVIDTSKRQIIYAHCVAPNKVFGPDGSSNPYTIMTHSEDRQGASVRS